MLGLANNGHSDLPVVLGALSRVSDAVILLACMAITIEIVILLKRRPDLATASRRLAYLIIAALAAFGATKFSAVVAPPRNGIEFFGVFDAVIAVLSVAIAVYFWLWLPKSNASHVPRTTVKEAIDRNETASEADLALRAQEHARINRWFELALERSNITLFAQDEFGRNIWFFNPNASSAAAGAAENISEYALPPEIKKDVVAMKEKAMATGMLQSMPIAIASEGGGSKQFELTVLPTQDETGRIDGIVCKVEDRTEHHLSEFRLALLAATISESSKRFELALEDSTITVFEQSSDLRYTYVYNPAPGTSAQDFLGFSDSEIFSDTDCAKIVPIKRRVLQTGQRERFQTDLFIGSRTRFVDVTLEPKYDDNDAIVGIVGTAVDVSASRNSEERMKTVLRELTHRSKNHLAVIQAMARQTAARSDDLPSFVSRFTARLQAMARTQDLIVSHSWRDIDVDRILRAQIAQIFDVRSARIRIDGPSVKVNAGVAQNLGLAFHELASNAAHFGALSVETGVVSVTWRRDGDRVRLVWQEKGGPAVAAPARTGFGQILLNQTVGKSLGGSAQLSFDPDGLRCEIEFLVD